MNKIYFISIFLNSALLGWEFVGTPVGQNTNKRYGDLYTNTTSYTQTPASQQEIIEDKSVSTLAPATTPKPSIRAIGTIGISTETENFGPQYRSQYQRPIGLDKPEDLIPITPMSPRDPAPYPLEKRYKQ